MSTESIDKTGPILTADEIISLSRELKQLDFSIEIRQHLDALTVLDTVFARGACGEHIKKTTLVNVLAPIFCSTPAEQTMFRSFFPEWWEKRDSIAEKIEAPASIENTQCECLPGAKHHHLPVVARLLTAVATVSILVITGLQQNYTVKKTTTVPVSKIVVGKVIDKITNIPVPNTVARWEDKNGIDSAVSDTAGLFILKIDNGLTVSISPPPRYLKASPLFIYLDMDSIIVSLTPDPGPQIIRGTVVSSDSVSPVSGVTVSLGQIFKTTTNNRGYFELSCEPATEPVLLNISTGGYINVSHYIPIDGTLSDTLLIPLKQNQPAEVDSLNELVGRINALAVERQRKFDNRFVVKNRVYMTTAAIVFPLVVFLVWFIVGYIRHKALFRKHSTAYTPKSRSGFVKGASGLLFRGPLFKKVMREFRRHTVDGAPYLDLIKSIQYTITRCGLFEPVYTHRHTLPEYLVLIDRKDLNDQYASFINELILMMRQYDISVDSYYFDGTPRYLHRTDGKAGWVTITQLAEYFPRHRIMVFSDCSKFFNSITGLPHTWIDKIFPWHQRSVFLPATTRYATIIERILKEKGFSVQPADISGLQRQTEVFLHVIHDDPEWESKRSFPAFLEGYEEICIDRLAPSQDIVNRIIEELGKYLGKNNMYLLGACAVYPTLRYELTLYLIVMLTIGHTGEMNEEGQKKVQGLVADITRLPWFHNGTMPDWLRVELLSRLSQSQHGVIRKTLNELIGNVKNENGTTKHKSSIELSAARYSFIHSIEEIKVNVCRIMRLEMQDPMHDHVFANYILGGNPGRLSVLIPPAVRKIFFRSGSVLFGWCPWAIPGITVAIIIGALAAIRIGLSPQQEPPIPVFFEAEYDAKKSVSYSISKEPAAYFTDAYMKWGRRAGADNSEGSNEQKYFRWLVDVLQENVAFDTAANKIYGTLPDAYFNIVPNKFKDRLFLVQESSANIKDTLQFGERRFGRNRSINHDPIDTAGGTGRVRMPAESAVVATSIVTDNNGEAITNNSGDTIKSIQEIATSANDIPSNKEMVKINGGTFLMGSENGKNDEKPIHKVSVNTFYIDPTEVTQEEFKQLFGYNPSYFNSCPLCPVEQVTWYDAILYCNARTKQTGSNDTIYSYTSKSGTPGVNLVLRNVRIDYKKLGFRLPTEAEWEYACRAGSTTNYYWGDTVNGEYAWHWNNANGKTHNVAQKLPNKWNLYDMSGNVWEWCNDFYDGNYYQKNITDDPKGPDAGSTRIVRGGTHYYSSDYMRSSFRGARKPEAIDDIIGFRCVRSEKRTSIGSVRINR